MAYPTGIWKSAMAATAEFGFVACAGAQTGNLETTFKEDDPQLDSLSAGTDLVTITIGGNDMDFDGILKFCGTPLRGDCFDPNEEFRSGLSLDDWMTQQTEVVAGDLEELFQDIRDRTSPSTTVVVLGYPRLFPVSSRQDCEKLRAWASEMDDLNAWTSYFNSRIEEEAVSAGLKFLNMESVFAGHETCGADGEWINAVVGVGDDPTFHPKAAGQEAMADAVNAYLDDPTHVNRNSAGLPLNGSL